VGLPLDPVAGRPGRAERAARRAAARAEAARLHRQLFALAQDASQYLRRHASAAVRLTTALLLAACLAACNASASDTTMVETRAVAPLTHEVVAGLPRGPGTYEVVPGSVFRDQRGVYQFEWLAPGQTSTPGQVAHVSRLRLARDDRLALQTFDDQDPVLHLTADEDVGLIQQAQVGTAQPGLANYPPVYSYWSPWHTAMLFLPRPAYYDPPRTIIVERDPANERTTVGGGSGGSVTSAPTRVGGGSVSETARPPAQRVSGVQTAVSGRAGGTGAGNAVTSRNVASGAASSASRSSAASGDASASGATSGTGGTSGASASSGSSSISAGRTSGSGGVSAPRSGGFSAGSGSSGGSSAS
jgi:hypothetical protein